MARDRTNPDSLRGQNVVPMRPRSVPRPAPGQPSEPRWIDYFPGDENIGLRRLSRREWRYILAQLAAAGVVVTPLDLAVLEDYTICRVRIRWLENELSGMDAWHPGSEGAAKSPLFSPLNQYRAQLKFYVDRLGLSPRSRQDLHQERPDDDAGLDLD